MTTVNSVSFKKRLVNKFISLTLDKFENFTRKYLYYTPAYSRYYSRLFGVDSSQPEIYNKYGERLTAFFLADPGGAHSPYKPSSRYIFWDRFNYGLKTHFYISLEAFITVGNPDKRFALLPESRSIVPSHYKKYIRHKKYIENEFDAVFTYDDEILSTFSNVKFLPYCSGYWYGNSETSTPQDNEWKNKNKNISIISSYKDWCELHIIRKNLALKCKSKGLADTFGTFDGGSWVRPEDFLKNYRFHIALENDITDYFFTEKITNCFAAQAIPIYLGEKKINEFFNPDGIIQISLDDLDNIERILAQCTPEEYERRLPAVLDNYERVKEYKNPYDYLYEKYFM
ncbi:MAG: hypothetical protein IJ597_06485 [Synergistaceae bacterium]|nr:hypothetical protein [Synergistaceae bacterium]